jgi:hypothetical protein
MLLYEARGCTYRKYRSVSETLIAMQRLMVLLLNFVFHLGCDMRPKGLHPGNIEASRIHPILSNGL